MLINPSVEKSIGSNGEVYATTTKTEFANGASISFSLADGDGTAINDGSTVSSEITPGLVTYIDNIIKLSTIDISRFYVGVQAAATDGSVNLTGTNSGATISPVAANSKPTAFGDNTWGYAFSGDVNTNSKDMTYNPLPAYNASTPLQYTSANNLSNGGYDVKLSFAAKITANQPADHYTTKVVISVAADARQTVEGFLNSSNQPITTMQEITSDICAKAPIHYTTQLKDSRDSKYYWVTKLKDGNCWMTQNLDFDIPTTLTPETSDIAETMTSETTKITDIAKWAKDDEGNTLDLDLRKKYNAYYDPGDKYYAPSGADPTDQHYHVGNYYSFSAATAKSGDSLTNDGNIAPNSICPRNWQLPLTSNENGSNNISKSFYYLLDKYGIQNDAWGSSSGPNVFIYDAPLYFVRGGQVHGPSMIGVDSFTSYLSSVTKDDIKVYVTAQANNFTSLSFRWYGFSIRCVAR